MFIVSVCLSNSTEYSTRSYYVNASIFGVFDNIIRPEDVALGCLDIPVAIHIAVTHKDATPTRTQSDVVLNLIIVP